MPLYGSGKMSVCTDGGSTEIVKLGGLTRGKKKIQLPTPHQSCNLLGSYRPKVK